jgi:2-polyprenyl-3-methyl-5-hydroxy-6-metoxy-1,4-benzoquinol methylase
VTANLEAYRASDSEKRRTDDLIRLLPRGRKSVLDIGARDGHFSKILTQYFESVTALDLEKPSFTYPGVVTVKGDVTRLQFPSNSFDCVFCTEVLEHVPALQQACAEILRVARHEIVIGVPFRQDIRVGRTTCRNCGKTNPPWGHVNSFDEKRLRGLFPGSTVVSKSFVGTSNAATNALATSLMDLAGNPWGTYQQGESCIHCGAKLLPPAHRSVASRICSTVALKMNRIQTALTRPHANWMHIVLLKSQASL